MFTNLLKATISTALTPVALVADIVTLPASADSVNRGPFDRTAKLLKNAGECVNQAVKPKR